MTKRKLLSPFQPLLPSKSYKTDFFDEIKYFLKKKGLKEIENPIGKELDTDFHEAITNIPAPTKKEKGKVIDVIEKGYMLGDKILRYVKVVMGN